MKTIKSSTELCLSHDKVNYVKCVADSIIDDVTKISDSKDLVARYRDKISSRLRNYTCADPTIETTPHLPSSYSTSYDGKEYEVRVLLDMDSAKVWYIDNFITQDECNVLMNFGRPRLARATVAGEDGNSVVSENRKAQQAHYDTHYHSQNPTRDPLYPLAERILAITNTHAEYSLTHEGQEGFTIIQYNPTDQYTPHCDGTCDGSKHHPGGRVATSIVYCKVRMPFHS